MGQQAMTINDAVAIITATTTEERAVYAPRRSRLPQVVMGIFALALSIWVTAFVAALFA